MKKVYFRKTIPQILPFLVLPCLTSCSSYSPPPNAGEHSTTANVHLNLAGDITPAPAPTPTPAATVYTITPFTGYSDKWSASNAHGDDFPGAYTRVIVTAKLDADGKATASTKTTSGDEANASASGSPAKATQAYPYQPRPWIWRALWGEEFAINLSARVTADGFDVVIPLATLGHQSNSEGEQWQRVVYHDVSSFPLFLIKTSSSGMSPRVAVSLNGTKTITSRGASAGLSVALQLVNAVSKMPPVVTTLTQGLTREHANAVDTAISQLFSEGISESQVSDRDLRLWNADLTNQGGGLEISFSIPRNEGNWDSDADPIGVWNITFDAPRPSIFSDWRACGENVPKIPHCATNIATATTNVLAAISANEVLSYNLVDTAGQKELGSISSYLLQKDWYSTSMAAFGKANTQHDVDNFCRQIRSAITSLNLNGFDADIVTWGVYAGMPLPDGVADKMATSVDGSCGTVIPLKKNRAP
ncbi:hypothetical protein [Silvimonas sp.]|uniref:hypothetical protein n=1 Tax=Silvimonas sp. TaxID=2650811 RepID=UPI00284B6EF6|nr:hypothetical protein [Silvimonas sp.]MDR3429006.1 hypothetical protein [Silvimonas sp.]